MAGPDFDRLTCKESIRLSLPADEPACRKIVQSLPFAVVLLDAESRIVVANSAAGTLFQQRTDRLRGLSLLATALGANLGHVLRDFGARAVNVVEAVVPAQGLDRSAVTLKITVVRLPPAAERRRNGSASPARDFRLLVLEDVSDKAVLEQQLVQIEKQAAMGQLAAGILHEIANPLTSLGSNLLFVRSTLARSADEKVTQAIDVSLDQLSQMRQLLGTLSGFPGRAAPRFTVADLHDVVRSCVSFIAKDAERRRIQLAASFAPSVVSCEMDVRLIKQVLLNVLKNAMEAMPNGGRLDVRTSSRAAEQEPAAVLVEVADTGIGIPEADLRKVFRPLFSTKPRGAGLGLSFCRQAVEEHGGEIRLLSDGYNKGTTVLISLPLRQALTAYE
jgi:signal transduction histidine kinase